MRRGLAALLIAAGLTAGATVPAMAQPEWGKTTAPAPGAARIFGSYTNGCIAGARSLPPEGPGHQVVRMSRNRYFGHPETVDYLLNFGRRVAGAKLGIALIGDMSQPRGGPMAFGHASHEIGLDADVWFRLNLPPLPRIARENLDLPSMVDPVTQSGGPETLHRQSGGTGPLRGDGPARGAHLRQSRDQAGAVRAALDRPVMAAAGPALAWS